MAVVRSLVERRRTPEKEGDTMLMDLLRKLIPNKQKPKSADLTDEEFSLLTYNLRDRRYVGVYSTDESTMALAKSLVSKGCLVHFGHSPFREHTYHVWTVTAIGRPLVEQRRTPETDDRDAG